MLATQIIERFSPRLLRIGLILEALVLSAAAVESGGSWGAFFQAAARLSGRVSLLFFALLLLYATLHPHFERSVETFRVKYRLYRDFAVVHTIHWCLLATSVSLNGFELVPARLAGGSLAYVLVIGMPFVVGRDWVRGSALNQLQGFYLFWVWLVFMLTYVARLQGQTPDATGSPAAWWPLAAFTFGLMVWRVWRLWINPRT